MKPADGDRDELTPRNRRLPVSVVTPADSGSVRPDPARMKPADEIAMNSPPGTDACPFLSSPQQIAVLSGLIPHECALPAEIAMNSPPGTDACPLSLLPQQ